MATEQQVFALLFPEYVDYRCILRLSSSSKEAATLLEDALKHIARHYCPVVWKRLREAPSGWSHPLVQHPKMTFVDASAKSPSGVFWFRADHFKAQPPSCEQTRRLLKTSLCRECFQSTRAVATAFSGCSVLVCRECSKRSDSYSSLVDTAGALACAKSPDGFCLKKAAVMRVLATLGVARRGGNRAKLYWKHEVVDALARYQERRANTVTK